MPEFGYDPIPLILSGEKVHTLRKQRCHWNKEVTVGGKRTGIVIRFGACVEMRMVDVTDEFARADGFVATEVVGRIYTPSENLNWLMEHFYGDEPPETMWCSHFSVVQRPNKEEAK